MPVNNQEESTIKGRMFSCLHRISTALSGKGLGKIPGLRTVHNFIYKKLEPEGVILMDIQGNKMYVDTQDKVVTHHLLVQGIWERWMTELFKRLITPSMVVVDVGANIGYYTLIAAKLLGGEGKVYAFEPEPHNFELLVKNIQINGYSNVFAFQKAVSNKEGKIKLFLNKDNLGKHSLSENLCSSSGAFLEVESIRLDDFFEDLVKEDKVGLLKIDVEGAEGLVCEGAERILQGKNVKLLMEFWPYGLQCLGTYPLELLHKLKNAAFEIKLFNRNNRTVEKVEIEKVFEMCEEVPGQVDLFLEKS